MCSAAARARATEQPSAESGSRRSEASRLQIRPEGSRHAPDPALHDFDPPPWLLFDLDLDRRLGQVGQHGRDRTRRRHARASRTPELVDARRVSSRRSVVSRMVCVGTTAAWVAGVLVADGRSDEHADELLATPFASHRLLCWNYSVSIFLRDAHTHIIHHRIT